MLQSSGMHAASQLEDAQRQLADLQHREQNLREQLSHKSLQAVNQINRSGGIPSEQEAAERPLPDLLREATTLDAGVTYLERLEAS